MLRWAHWKSQALGFTIRNDARSPSILSGVKPQAKFRIVCGRVGKGRRAVKENQDEKKSHVRAKHIYLHLFV
jgi:hypothetical protein